MTAAAQPFLNKSLGSWNDDDWKSFYTALHHRGGILEVKAGNAIVNWPFWRGFPVHFQIEKGDISFKINFDPEETENINFDADHFQERWTKLLLTSSSNKFPIQPALLLSKSVHRTVGLISKNKWLGEDDEILNMSRTLNRLQEFCVHVSQLIFEDWHNPQE